MTRLIYAIGLIICGTGCAKEEPSEATSTTSQKSLKSTPDASPPKPLEGKSVAEICSNDNLALIRWSFDELQNGFADLCCGDGGLDDGRCELDWPFSDVPGCDVYDDMRNGIFARYGYPFKKKEWRQRFEKTSWYKKREDFNPQWVPQVASRNVEKLKQLKKQKTGCFDE
jgi:hypothetical protein